MSKLLLQIFCRFFLSKLQEICFSMFVKGRTAKADAHLTFYNLTYPFLNYRAFLVLFRIGADLFFPKLILPFQFSRFFVPHLLTLSI